MSARQQRQGFRLSVKKAVDAVSELKSQSPTPENQEQLLRKSILLNSYLPKLEAFDNSVLDGILDEKEAELEISSIRAFNEGVEEAIAESQPLPSGTPFPTSPGGNGQGAAGGSGPLRVHLPKLEIPPFNGDPIRWQEFWDAFKSAIHDRPDLAPVDKFTYLRGLLVGEALRLVEGFRVTDVNYREVVDVLTQRYGDKQAVIFAHIDALLSLPPATGDAASLVNTHVKLERHLRSLDSLQPDQDMILYSVILSKLPRFLKVEAHRKKGSQAVWSLTELRQWLREEILAREMGERLHRLNADSRENAQPPFKGRGVSRDGSSNAKTTGSASALVSYGKDSPCAYCNGSHLPDRCTTYTDSSARRAQLRNRCLSCLWKGHLAKDCRRRRPCQHCSKPGHHSSLCFSRFGQPKQRKEPDATQMHQDSTNNQTISQLNAPEDFGASSSVLLASDKARMRAVMQTAIAPLESNSCGRKITARLFFDTGASRSFITDAKRKEMRLSVTRPEVLSVSSFQSLSRQTSEHKIVEFGVKCRDGTVQQVEAAGIPSITCPILKVPLASKSLPFPNWSLAEPLIQQSEFVGIDVLIGMDYYYSFVDTERLHGGDNLWFLSSKLGYLSAGRVASFDEDNETVAVMFVKTLGDSSPTDTPMSDLSRYWELEELGFKEKDVYSSTDDEAVSAFSSTVEFNNGRYEVCWPWKTPTQELRDNYGLAHGRLRTLLGRLRQNQDLGRAYADVFQTQLNAGMIEEVPPRPSGDVVYYMPHHGVQKSQATTKLRIVFDASSKATKDAASLNECLHRGPVLLEDLCGLLLRFRMHKVALVSDIEKAFLQIGLQKSQRDATRFLWVKNLRQPATGDNLVVYRFCRVPFGVISSPSLLAATVSHHLKRQQCVLAEKILHDIYVDNVITGEASPEEAITHYQAAKRIFHNAAMNLREWYTNSNDVRGAIPEIDHGKGKDAKVLGLRWNTKDDTFRVNSAKQVDENVMLTKRRILKSLPQVFDPCGLFAPVIVTGKLLLQDCWLLGIGWDDPVPDALGTSWKQTVLPNLHAVNTVSIPRYIGSPNASRCELHVFCDASARACAAAVYLRQEQARMPAKVDILMAKSRLAPTKQKLTIPRLELVAVVLGARLLNFVSTQLRLKTDQLFVWTDSQCVLCWLSRNSGLPRFVDNRIKELKQRSNVAFKYTPTQQNPADLPTRGCTVQQLSASTLWWHGPDWLRHSESYWPSFPAPQEPETTTVDNKDSVAQVGVSANTEQVLDETRYSSYQRLIRVTAYTFRYIRNLRKPRSERLKRHLLPEEINDALEWWIRRVQKDYFFKGEEAADSQFKSWSKRQVKQLDVFRDDKHIIRCRGRFGLSDMSNEAKQPILLPSCYFSELIVKFCHKQSLHSGVSGTLAHVRRQFWILKGRPTVKRVIRACRVCRRYDGGSFTVPNVPPLPRFRLEEKPPFTNTGVDYMGPLFIAHPDGTSSKVWICLFTCAVTRAVHLEVVEDMTTDQFLLAFRRFVAVYGAPSLIVSDNGKQFNTTSRLFRYWWKEFCNDSNFRNFTFSQGIAWKFITEKAPWMGGFYERLVGIVKQALRKTLHNVRASLSELRTIVAEIVSVVNSRPLTYLEDDIRSIPLSPSNLISPLKREEHPLLRPQHTAAYALPPVILEQLRTRWRHLQGVVNNFWRSWRSQYLLSLRERRVTHRQRGTIPWSPKVGTVVHLKQDVPRSRWRLGRIHSLHPSADGEIRSAIIRLASGGIIRRPLKLIYPLEFDETKTEAVTDVEHPSIIPSRPTRAAATAARRNWQHGIATSSDED